ncbi:2-succinyl-5-enolpyruvyl-6-hydroxy-3-cyclohexene-1-carboxylic-acid synthase [Blattabacterium cuenoti]|uniref:2-succinyl-5-enolpyruvyl-6-hydroxy-3- cyclohexene-1-carboxylic-acid synthase n=1 Tax=Blattabacterium cuenoti TaxID=1653831 RepID=UPI001EEBF659|nr:2-succinyl-5-enolpyruvyl-6-hydroxy-3-cyclohexene-1-carboxylic-acid synthase [Blattabacterium cuenoti]
MIYSKKKIVQSLGIILISKSIFHIVISPGSRNAPIIIHFTINPYFKTYSIVDERSAGYFALGMAQQINNPVLLNCTSGTSVLNYYPALTEAFYQYIPLIFITADRPKETPYLLENQSIHQENIFKNYVVASVQLTEEESNNGLWYNEKLINEAINNCIKKNRPVHINIPFTDPLYDTVNHIQVKPKIIKDIPVVNTIVNYSYIKEKKIWERSKKKIIFIGLHPPNKHLKRIIQKFNQDSSIVIFSDTSSQLYDKFLFSIDQLFFNMKLTEWLSLKPQILLTIGGHIISNRMKYIMRKYPPKYHWHIGEETNHYPDTYYKLTIYWPIQPEIFFNILKKQNINDDYYNYKKKWIKLRNQRKIKNNFFLKKENSFSDLKVLFLIFNSIPKTSILHLGNSTIIRYYQLFDIKKHSIKYYCNRGTSGIDGSVSTAIGHSINSSKIVTLVIGDISFFYDSNALWNNYTPNRFRIILINNGGGNIFRLITKKKIHKNTFDFFETKHSLTAKQICEMYHWKYKYVSNIIVLKKVLSSFWNKSNKPILLELNTTKSNNKKIFNDYISFIF